MPDIELLEGEEWRPVVGYEGQYEVSNMGRVCHIKDGHASLLKLSIHKKGKPSSNGSEYRSVNLFSNKKAKTVDVHRLVAEAFIGPRPKGMETMHINGIRYDNRLSNLRYGTNKENHISNYTYGATSGGGKLSIKDVLNIRQRLKNGEYGTTLAREYGVNHSAIYNVKLGKTFKWLKEDGSIEPT